MVCISDSPTFTVVVPLNESISICFTEAHCVSFDKGKLKENDNIMFDYDRLLEVPAIISPNL